MQVALTRAAVASATCELTPGVNANSPGVIDTGAWDALGDQRKADYFADISARNPTRQQLRSTKGSEPHGSVLATKAACSRSDRPVPRAQPTARAAAVSPSRYTGVCG
jgi:hypothetical protein